MIKTVLTTIAAAGLTMSVMAQKDSAAIKIKSDTIKSKQTGAVILNENLLAFNPQVDSSKTKAKAKPATKPDTLKTGFLKSSQHLFLAMGPQTDSLKAKPKAVDTVKTGTKYRANVVTQTNSVLAFAPGDGPQTDSSKTKPATIIKQDSTTTKPADKKTGAIQNKSLFKTEILEA